MKFIQINERAAAVAIDAIVGPEKRVLIQELYDLLDAAERAGNTEGFDKGVEAADELNDGLEETAYRKGYLIGYCYGHKIATSTEQPNVISMPPYVGDSGDETTYFRGEGEHTSPSDGALYAAIAQREAAKAEGAYNNPLPPLFPAPEAPYTLGELVGQQNATNPFAWSSGPVGSWEALFKR